MKEGAIGRFVAIVRGLRGVVLDTGIVYISAALLSGVSIVVLPRELLWSGYGKARLVLKNGAVIEAVGEREVDELLARYRGQTAVVTLSGGQARGLIVAVVASSAIAMIGYSVLRLKGELWRLLRFDRRAAVLGCGLAAAVFGIMFWLERSLLPGGAGLCQLLHSLTLREFSFVLILVGLVAPFAEDFFFEASSWKGQSAFWGRYLPFCSRRSFFLLLMQEVLRCILWPGLLRSSLLFLELRSLSFGSIRAASRAASSLTAFTTAYRFLWLGEKFCRKVCK